LSANYKRSSKPRKVLENYTITEAFCDRLGVIRVDLLTNESEDVDPGARSTLPELTASTGTRANFWACSMARARIA
jgi:hypothetical protein